MFSSPLTAADHADAGGVGLHVWGAMPAAFVHAPACFKRSSEWGHLFCNDPQKLSGLARDLGVRNVQIQRRGRRGQHVDLCGRPLSNAIQKARTS